MIFTDGHILFDTNEFEKGKSPAINIALSVTRIGRQTQSVLLQDINRQLSSFLTSKYEKSLQLSHFGSELTSEVKRDLEVGSSLYGFFSQNTGLVVPLVPALIFVGIIWLDIFQNESITKIFVYRDVFIKKYNNDDKLRQKFDTILDLKTFKQLLVKIMSQKDELLQLCKVTKIL